MVISGCQVDSGLAAGGKDRQRQCTRVQNAKPNKSSKAKNKTRQTGQEFISGAVQVLFFAFSYLWVQMMDERVCKRCGKSGGFREEILTNDGPHYGKLLCRECGAFFSWMPKPKNETKRVNGKHTAESLGFTACQMCERPGDRLGLNETLEVHHVEEIHRGGLDVVENIWCVCTPCHKQIHHNRTYLNEHQKHKVTPSQLIELMERDRVPESVRGYMLKMLELSNG